MSDISLIEKIRNFDKPWCYQYQRRIDTIEEDKELLNLTDADIENISLDDFEFSEVSSSKDLKQECTDFIKRYEWMGTVGSYPTHWFTARWKGHLGGVE